MIYYIIFALATAIYALFTLVQPVLALAKKNGIEKQPAYITYITFFLLILLVAPTIFLPCIVPSMSDRFRVALYQGLFEKD